MLIRAISQESPARVGSRLPLATWPNRSHLIFWSLRAFRAVAANLKFAQSTSHGCRGLCPPRSPSGRASLPGRLSSAHSATRKRRLSPCAGYGSRERRHDGSDAGKSNQVEVVSRPHSTSRSCFRCIVACSALTSIPHPCLPHLQMCVGLAAPLMGLSPALLSLLEVLLTVGTTAGGSAHIVGGVTGNMRCAAASS